MPHPVYLKECYPQECNECPKNWNCQLDGTIPCSPDCEYIDSKTGDPSGDKACHGCDAAETNL